MVIGLFVYDTVTEKELTADQYKLLKFYKLNTKRELSSFNLASGNRSFKILLDSNINSTSARKSLVPSISKFI